MARATSERALERNRPVLLLAVCTLSTSLAIARPLVRNALTTAT